MDKEIIKILNEISNGYKLWIKDACQDIKTKNPMHEEIIEFCKKCIKEAEEEQIGMFGEIIYDTKKTDTKNFLLSIQKLNINKLEFLKEIFECAYNDSKRQSYNIISDFIDLTIELRKQIVSSTISQIQKIPHEKHDCYFELLPKYLLEQIADVNEVKLEEVKEKVLKKISA